MQYINETKRLQQLAGIITENQDVNELFGSDHKYSLEVTVREDNRNMKKGTYTIDLPSKMWPGLFNSDDKKLFPFLKSYPSGTEIVLKDETGEELERGSLIWYPEQGEVIKIID
jgi:hypothetical protein